MISTLRERSLSQLLHARILSFGTGPALQKSECRNGFVRVCVS